MSRIWEKLKQVQQHQSGSVHSEERPASAPLSERRSTKRLLVHLTILVRGRDANDEPFQEETEAFCVNASGALITLTTSVKHGQTLVLTNKLNQNEGECQVVYQGSTYLKTTVIGVGFLQPTPVFWNAEPQSDAEPNSINS